MNGQALSTVITCTCSNDTQEEQFLRQKVVSHDLYEALWWIVHINFRKNKKAWSTITDFKIQGTYLKLQAGQV